MNTPRWERAKEIFDAALDLQPEVRSEYLLQTCSNDIELRHEVEGLLAADSEAGSFMNPGWLAPFSPFAPEPEFQLTPGDIVSGRFKIVRPLGDGGMGRVYEAHDSVLGVQVALKTLRPEISANPEILFRFRQEVRIAHRITHPNVCRTYHLDHELRKIGADESSSVDLTFLTMEFLEGETLQQLLKRSGRLSLSRAFSIAHQMAEAIDAAHQIGVVHRDIKPGNVMICPPQSGAEREDRVVVTDFGLAKFEAGAANNDHSSISQPGRAMGTLSYMSPEQLKGEEVGPATDIYAFGLILYEMVTGTKAFPDSSTMTVAYRRTSEPPPSPRTVVADLPAAWETAILGCLQIDTSARFQRATDVIDILDGSTPHSSRLRAMQRTKVVHNKKSSRRTLAIIFSVVSAVALLAIGSRYYFTREGSTVAPGTLVYLAPVKNETGEKQLDNVTELVRAGLKQSAHINLLDAGRVGDTLQQMTKSQDAVIDDSTAREIAMRTGAPRVVFTTLKHSGDTYSFDIDIQQPDNTPSRYRNHWAKTFIWHSPGPVGNSATIPSEVLTNVRESNDWIRLKVGESANDIAHLDTPPEDVTTDNWQALNDFSHAAKLQITNQRPQAVALLRDALNQDPKFALAYALLGDILYTMDRSSEGNLAYRSALQLVGQNRLSLRERDRIKGLIAHDTHDYQAAAEAYLEYTSYYPNDYTGWFRLGRPLALLGRTQESIDALLAAHNADPSKPSAPTQLVRGYQLLHDPTSTHMWLETMRRDYPSNDYLFALAPNQFLEGDYAAVEQTMHALSNATTPLYRDIGFLLLADLYAERGNDPQMLDALNKALDKQQNGRTQLFYRAELYCKLHNVSGCINDLERAISLQPGFDGILATSGVLGRSIANASGSQKQTLVAYLVSLDSKQPGESFGLIADLAHLVLRGEILLAQGRPDAAVEEFRKAAVLDAPINPKEYLARALAASAKAHSKQPEGAAYAREAASLYATTANNPEKIWWFALGYPPGSYTNSIIALLKLQALFPGVASNQDALTKTLLELRPSANGTFVKASNQ